MKNPESAHFDASPSCSTSVGWQRVKLGDICRFVNGNAHRESDWSKDGLPIIRIQNLNDSSKPFNYWSGPEKGKTLVNKGDVLLAWSGTPGTSFGAHLWRGERAVLNQHIFRVDFDTSLLDSEYGVFAINQQLNVMIAKSHGGVGLRHVTRREVDNIEIPLPPLGEQRRIVARLNKQMAVYVFKPIWTVGVES